MNSVLTQLEDILNKLEQDTGNKYQITLKQLGGQEVTIKGFSERKGYRVYDMKEGYELLNGEYNSVKEIEDKILQLIYDGVQVTTTPNDKGLKFWTCPRCGQYEKNWISHSSNICQHCYGNDYYWKCLSCEEYKLNPYKLHRIDGEENTPIADGSDIQCGKCSEKYNLVKKLQGNYLSVRPSKLGEDGTCNMHIVQCSNSYHHVSKWQQVKPYVNINMVGRSGGGSLSVITSLGRIEVL
ncbi:Hypothetical protein ORPV_571 [Orpheovirus IHUMI-LCC2]|uniref:Uncharacterized protein n=1 Tax=Orpheovirus IHUMI-LCC2 TaxID=2023057 RepID=A0A2I2L4J1_9VIRU|nr:Hypothetical protein ORPV_571 [Orpheovirus IHUMI-LCC2]SNW62475.1 Hypothetical protein ORPV_571 [Orpheovirus IHUMI-LCC2]